MKLALRELRRRPGRFVTATVILTLVAVLVMFLGGLLDGLISGATGALRAQQADVIVYSDTARSTFARSRIDADTRAAVEAVPGVARTGGIGIVQLGARVPGNGPRDLAATALFGYELAPSGIPEPPGPGEVYADDVLRADGVEVGMEILLGPARSPVTVIGFVTDVSYSGQGSLWAEPGTWREVMAANRPDVRLPDDSFQALVVQAADGVDADQLAAEIDDAVGGRVESLSITEAIDDIPGVRQQRSTFNQIIGVTIAIAAVVVALFFALLTVERLALYGVLKALSCRNWEARSWRLSEPGSYEAPGLREAGFWRFVDDPADPCESEAIELLADSAGYVELFYGSPLTQSSWELVTDALARSKSGVLVGGAKRLYGIVEGGDLAYVEERVDADGGLVPHLSARLSRFVG